MQRLGALALRRLDSAPNVLRHRRRDGAIRLQHQDQRLFALGLTCRDGGKQIAARTSNELARSHRVLAKDYNPVLIADGLWLGGCRPRLSTAAGTTILELTFQIGAGALVLRMVEDFDRAGPASTTSPRYM